MNKIKIQRGRNTITTDVAYIAGFFDGEGCITHINPNRLSWRIQFSQSDRPMLLKVKRFLRQQGIKSKIQLQTRKYSKPHFKTNKSCWMLLIGGRENTMRFLRGTLPYLVLKKTLAQDLRRFLILYGDLRAWNKPPQQSTCANAKEFRQP